MAVLQGLFAVVLIALFWILHARFRRSDFLLLWRWAWAVYLVGLIAGYLPPLAGIPAGSARSFLAWLFTSAGFVHAALVFLGTRAFAREEKAPRKLFGWIVGALLLGLLVFFASVELLPAIDTWLGTSSASGTPLQPVAVRVMLRQSAIAAAYLLSAWIFWRRRANSRLPGPQFLTAACFLYGSFQLLFAANLLLQARVPIPRTLPVPPYFVDLSCQVLFGLGIVLFLLDEYRRILEARGEVEARFSGVAHSLAEGLLVTDPQDVVLFANQQIAQMTGYAVSELVGRPGYALFLPEKNWPTLWKKNKERMSGVLDRYELEMRRKDGTPFWVEVSASPYLDLSGQIIGTLGAITDITERRRFAQALAASEEKFSKAFLSSPDAIAITTLAEGRYVEVNESFCAMTGYSRDSLLGRSTLDLGIWAQAEARVRLVDLLKSQKRVRDFAVEFRKKSGNLVEGIASAELIDIAGEPCLLSITRDVTQQKRGERLQSVLYEITQAADSAPDRGALFAEVHRIIQQVMPAENFYIALYDESLDVLSFPYFVDAHDQPRPPGPPGRGNTAYVLRNGVSLLSPIDVHEKLKQQGQVETVGVLSEVWLGVPLKAAGKCIGVMAVQHYTDRAAFGEKEQRILEFVSAQVATAIQRKQSDEALRASEEKFSRAFQSSPDAMTISHFDDSRFIEVNEGFLNLTGYSREEVLGQTSMDLQLWVHPSKRPDMAAQARHTGRVQDYEFELRKKDASVVIGLLSVDVIDVAGRKCFLSVIRDITARKRMEEALRLSEAKFSKAFFASPDAMVISNMETGVFVDVNEGFARLSGFSRVEAIGRSGLDLGLWLDERDRSRLIEQLRKGGGVRNMEFTFRSKAGRAIVALLSAEVIDFSGIQSMLVVVRDITERKEMEEALRTSEAKFRALAESSPYAILISRDNHIVFANRAAEEITGYTLEELGAVDPAALLSPQSLALVEEKRAQRKIGVRDSLRFEIKFTAKGGAEKWLDTTTSQITFEGAPAILANAMDVTERKAVEDQLRQSQKMEAVGRLAGGVAHDFNNLLMIMRGYADLILDSESADEATRRNAEQITKASERAAGLTQQLLAFSRKQVLAPQVIDLQEILHSIQSMLMRLIGEDVDLTVHADSGLWPVKADPHQVEQVLLNLAINARDAMPTGGKLMVEVRNIELDDYFVRHHAGASSGPHVVLSVTDTGLGMTPDVQARVFEPFFTTKEVGRGTGLGLATVYGIVKQSSGYITVYSEPGKGTAFKVYLPKAATAAPVETKLEPKTREGGHETILLVEDQAEVRALTREFLDSRGYRVLEAPDGNQALQVSRRHPGHIDLLLTDVVMPGISGRELADQIGAMRPGTKIIYVSGYTAEAIGHHGILDSGTEFLQKPYSREALARKLREVLDNNP